jgi:hypothetical protein
MASKPHRISSYRDSSRPLPITLPAPSTEPRKAK